MFEAILTISLLGLTALTVYVAFASIKKSYLEAKAEKQAIVDAVRARTQEANDKFYMNLKTAEDKVANIQASTAKVRSNRRTQTSSAPTYRSRQDDTSVDDSLLVTAAVVTAFATPSYESSSSSYSSSYSSYDSSSSSSDSSSSSSSD